jgi:hypothetical protein
VPTPRGRPLKDRKESRSGEWDNRTNVFPGTIPRAIHEGGGQPEVTITFRSFSHVIVVVVRDRFYCALNYGIGVPEPEPLQRAHAGHRLRDRRAFEQLDHRTETHESTEVRDPRQKQRTLRAAGPKQGHRHSVENDHPKRGYRLGNYRGSLRITPGSRRLIYQPCGSDAAQLLSEPP